MSSSVNRVAPGSITSTDLWNELVEALRRVTVQVVSRAGHQGGGVVWNRDGLIVTNAHVITGGTMIRLYDGRTCLAEVLRSDKNADLAMLRIPTRGIESAKLRDSSSLRPGEMLVALGHPMGAPGAMSLGIVHTSSKGRLIEADIRLAPGNSGGPLADVAGHVIGINCMVVNCMGVAISTAAIDQFLQESRAASEGTT